MFFQIFRGPKIYLKYFNFCLNLLKAGQILPAKQIHLLITQ